MRYSFHIEGSHQHKLKIWILIAFSQLDCSKPAFYADTLAWDFPSATPAAATSEAISDVTT